MAVKTFEDILYIVGDNGPFQKKFNLLFPVILSFFISMSYVNIFIAMMVPDHWCHVPGQNLTNLTNEEWRSLTIPLKSNNSNRIYSSCTMYNVTIQDLNRNDTWQKEFAPIDCQYGWNYNRNWYQETIPTQENWVCSNELHVTSTFTFLRIGELFGGILSGLFTDTLGRRPTYYVSALLITVCRLAALVTTKYLSIFLIMALASDLATTSVFQSPTIIAMEITSPENRAFVSIIQLVGYTAGICALPFFMWITAEWKSFLLVTTIPGLLYFLITCGCMIESPRWLLNSGKIDKCIEQLQKIAKMNKTHLPSDIYKKLDSLPKNVKKPMGFLSLFLHWRIAKNTICTGFCCGVFQMVYFIMVFNVTNLGGNPLLNFFLQTAVELPGGLLSKVSSDCIGRRWTFIIGFLATAAGCVPLIILSSDSSNDWLGTTISVLLKLTLAFGAYGMTLMCFELYPTCLRQTGLSFCSASANITALLSPYIVHLGTSVDASLPYVIILILTVAASVCGFMLPETLNQDLPDTIEEAQSFGKNQSFWGCSSLKQRFKFVTTNDDEEETAKL